ncbi:F-box protein [Yarrowia sp. B02]|nr:F-box protein [Yarrowia sp. B02]
MSQTAENDKDVLNRDILIHHVFPLLSPADIKNVSLTNKQLHEAANSPSVWHDLYLRTFGENPLTTHKWPEMYQVRSRSGLFTWGQNGRGKLGLNEAHVPSENKTLRGICKPTQVGGLSALVVSDISAGGWGFLLLDIEGHVYGIGSISDRGRAPYVPGRVTPNPHVFPYRNPRGAGLFGGRGPFPFRIGGVIRRDIPPANNDAAPTPPQPGSRPAEPTPTGMYGGDNTEPGTEPLGHGIGPAVAPRTTAESDAIMTASRDAQNEKKDDGNSEEDVRKHWLLKYPDGKTPKVVAISAGRSRSLALDEDNNVWQWDKTFYDAAARLEFSFGDKPILKIDGGWEKAAAVVQDVGLVVWDGISLTNVASVRPVEHETVPKTNLTGDDEIVDVAVGRDAIVYIDKKGDAFTIDINKLEKGPVRLDGFMNKLKLSDWKVEGRFVKLTGNLTHFAFISSQDDVYLTPSDIRLDAKTEPVIIPELQKKGCISVAAGDHHYLALMKGGKILAWGCESQACGDLGLGQAQEVINVDGATERGIDLVLAKPTEIPLEGHALAIAAGGWQSAAIITTDDIEHDEKN